MTPTARVHPQLKIMWISFFLSDTHAYLYADNTSVFMKIRTSRKSKIVKAKPLERCANSLLIISCQFISMKIKINIFFSMEKKPAGDNYRITQFIY